MSNEIAIPHSCLLMRRAYIWNSLNQIVGTSENLSRFTHMRKVTKSRWPLSRYRSNGIAVSQDVYRAMTAANKARDTAQWDEARRLFAYAAEQDPALPHIWMQLGHASHMSGHHQQGQQAYLRAAILDPSSGQAYVHALQWAESINDMEIAVDCCRAACLYEDSRKRGLQQLSFLRPALHDLIVKAGDLPITTDIDKWTDILPTYGAIDSNLPILRYGFDVSDLISHYKNSKFPTGIQRVQIEVIESHLNAGVLDAGIFFFVDGRNEFIELPVDLFIQLTRVSRTGSFDEWSKIRKTLFAQCAYGKPFIFSENMVVINLGTSWWMYNYFLKIRDLKDKKNIKFISYVHDLIPVLAPEHCVTGVTIDYITWLVGAYQHSDAFVTNSTSTTNDLLFTLHFMGHKISADIVKTLPLNASLSDMNDHACPDIEYVSLSKYAISRQSYVLFVSTIESRKNHELHSQHGKNS